MTLIFPIYAVALITKKEECTVAIKTMTGKYIGGRGISAGESYFEEKELQGLLGGVPFKGSFNILIETPQHLHSSDAVFRTKCDRRRFWIGFIKDEPVLFQRWKTCPLHVIEAISTKKLVDVLEARPGKQFEVKAKFRDLTRLEKLSWNFFWRGRESLYYDSDPYVSFVKKMYVLSRPSYERFMKNETCK